LSNADLLMGGAEESVNLILRPSGYGNGVFCWPLHTFVGMLTTLAVFRSTEEYGQTCPRTQAVLTTEWVLSSPHSTLEARRGGHGCFKILRSLIDYSNKARYFDHYAS
jgi:hypothetical protein